MITLPPGEPTIIRPSGFSMNVGVMLDSGRLPGATAFASAPIRRKPFGTPAFAAKSSISLFSITPVPGHHEAGAEEEVDRLRAGDAIAFRVDDREVRGLRTLARAFDARQHVARRRAIHAERSALPVGVIRMREPLGRHLDEIRIAEKFGAIAMRAAHRLDYEMLARGAVDRAEIEAGKNVERVDDRHAARRRRWRRHDARAAVFAVQRLALDHAVAREVFQRPDAAELAHAFDHALRDRDPCRSRRALARQAPSASAPARAA